ncbi:MAG TPA: hypothetical protein VG370_17730 [Chloroflexota bacterium]|nr:hypothetical protein [Chloroflexota bacterium]
MITVDTVLENKVRSYQESRRKGIEFLLGRMNPDGSIGPVDKGVFYSRVPWAFALGGETGAAMRVTEWIRRHMLTPEGEVAGSASPNAGMNRAANTYAETCLAYGAQLLRQYDIVRRTMRNALRFQDPVTGGVYQDRQRTGPDDPQILYLTCQLGMSALLTGYRAEAEAAGHFLKRLWAAQPELPDRLYTIHTRAGGLATEVPAGADRRHYVNESQDVQQMHYNGGMAAAFLTRLYSATDDAGWLDLARAYQAFSMNSTTRQFETKQVCKSAWGGGLLYAVTNEAVYRDWTVRMGDWFVAEQFPDGHWENSKYMDPDPPLHRNIAITAEFVVHMDTIASTLPTGEVD